MAELETFDQNEFVAAIKARLNKVMSVLQMDETPPKDEVAVLHNLVKTLRELRALTKDDGNAGSEISKYAFRPHVVGAKDAADDTSQSDQPGADCDFLDDDKSEDDAG